MSKSTPVFGPDERKRAQFLVQLALEEDLSVMGDITSKAVIPLDLNGEADYIARQAGVLAGLPVCQFVVESVDPALRLTFHKSDGDQIQPKDRIATLAGPLRSLLAAERTSLNFLQRLSGIATLTSRYVSEVRGTKCQVLDTRKTTPGWRVLEKYAVRCGGGTNHRVGLFDAVMIKDNHLAGLREHGTPLAEAVRQAKAKVARGTKVEVEVETLDQLQEALSAHPDVVLLDNMKPEMLREAVQLRDQLVPAVKLEASGGITLQSLATVAQSGVDFVSVGALTHSAPALDIALDYRV
jgi:nicotinate-nucleotide pyrophosphorylase (carboxylating)